MTFICKDKHGCKDLILRQTIFVSDILTPNSVKRTGRTDYIKEGFVPLIQHAQAGP